MFHPPKQLSSDSSFFWTSGSSTEQTHGSKRLNIMPSVYWILWHGCLDHHMVGRKQTAGCDIFEGGRCEITPRRFQVKSIIDKVSGLATRRATTWQPGFNGATRRGANTRQTHPEGKTNRKPGIQQGHNKHRPDTFHKVFRQRPVSGILLSQDWKQIQKLQTLNLKKTIQQHSPHCHAWLGEARGNPTQIHKYKC